MAMKALRLLVLAGVWAQLSLVPAAAADRSVSPSSARLDGERHVAAVAPGTENPECLLDARQDQRRAPTVDAWEGPRSAPDGTVLESSARAREGRGLLAQGGWGRRCYTPYGWCWLPRPAPLGYPCTCCCPVAYGFVDF